MSLFSSSGDLLTDGKTPSSNSPDMAEHPPGGHPHGALQRALPMLPAKAVADAAR
jgi:hypothetical protein